LKLIASKSTFSRIIRGATCMRMKKYFLLLCCFAFAAIAQADTATNTDLLETTKTQMVRQWEMPFVHLKSLQFSVNDFVTFENGKTIKQRLIHYGTFVYDDPKFLDGVTIVANDYTRRFSEGDQENKFTYDGNYYCFIFGPKGKDTFSGMRAKDMDETWPPVTINPLSLLFDFVINGTQAKNFDALTNPRTWDEFEKRITDFQEDPQSGDITFSCQSRNPENEVALSYEVKASKIDGIYFPVFVKTFTQKDKTSYNEYVVLKTKEVDKSAFALPFPVQIKTAGYDRGVLTMENITEVDVASMKINQPVNDAIFTVSAKGGKIIDVPILSLKSNH